MPGHNVEDREVPRLRGVLHAICAPIMLAAGVVLAWQAPSLRSALALLVMATGFAFVFGVSGVFHRVRWPEHLRRRARHVDHSSIYVGMAATYTAVWIVALDGLLADAVLAFAWIAAVIGVVAKLWLVDAPPSTSWIMYMSMGLVGLVVVPNLWDTMGPVSVSVMLLGAAIIAVGSIAYVLGRPNPVPGWFGHHEVFHAGTVIGCALFLLALADVALR